MVNVRTQAKNDTSSAELCVHFPLWTVFRVPANALRGRLLLLQNQCTRWAFQAGRNLHLKSLGHCHALAPGAGVRAGME